MIHRSTFARSNAPGVRIVLRRLNRDSARTAAVISRLALFDPRVCWQVAQALSLVLPQLTVKVRRA